MGGSGLAEAHVDEAAAKAAEASATAAQRGRVAADASHEAEAVRTATVVAVADLRGRSAYSSVTAPSAFIVEGADSTDGGGSTGQANSTTQALRSAPETAGDAFDIAGRSIADADLVASASSTSASAGAVVEQTTDDEHRMPGDSDNLEDDSVPATTVEFVPVGHMPANLQPDEEPGPSVVPPPKLSTFARLGVSSILALTPTW